jgi:hypothetical protein
MSKYLIKFTINFWIYVAFSTTGLIAQDNRQELPTEFKNNLITVVPITETGDTLRFKTDTGGGLSVIWQNVVEDLKLETDYLQYGSNSIKFVNVPNFIDGYDIPFDNNIDRDPLNMKLAVIQRYPTFSINTSGFLGMSWFANQIWEFDYVSKSLATYTNGFKEKNCTTNQVPLGFAENAFGQRQSHYPRIRVAVKGDSLDLLFDTGATLLLNDEAATELDRKGGPIATSFITETIFEKWQKENPDWRVIQNADETLDMPIIEVPQVSIANYEVGPVWFTMRPDENFTQYMSQFMDKTIEGALGGSALKYFKVIVDYPNAVAYFEKQ